MGWLGEHYLNSFNTQIRPQVKQACNNMYDSTEAYAALTNPMAKYKNVSMGIPLVNLVSKDISSFPGPASYKLKPTVNAITAGGYMKPHSSSNLFQTVPRIRPSEPELERIAAARAKELCTTPEKKHKRIKEQRVRVEEEKPIEK